MNPSPERDVRVVAWILRLAALAGLAVGVIVNPLVLEGAIFRPGEVLDSGRWRMGLHALSLMAIGASAVALVLASRFHSGRIAVDVGSFAVLVVSLVAGLAVALLLGEVYCRFGLDLVQVLPHEDDRFWEIRWRQGREARGDAPIDYPHDAYHPLLGWTSRPGEWEGGISITAGGFRGTREAPFEKPPGMARVVTIGDSFTFGEGVADDETWPSILERLLPGVRVLNFGVHAYGVDQQYLRLKHDALRYEPDLVMLGLFLPDAMRNLLTFHAYAKPRFVIRDDSLVLTNVPVQRPEDLLATPFPEQRLPSSYLATFLRGHLARIVDKTPSADSEKFDLMRELLELTLAETRAAGADLLLVLMPPGYGSAATLERLCLDWARENGVTTVNVRELFEGLDRDERTRMFLPGGGGHYSAHAYRKIARAIAAAIRERNLLPRAVRSGPDA